MPSQSSSTGSKGIAPHFNADAAGLLALYHNHAITHDELRAELEKLGLTLGPWPEGLPKPHLYKLWQGVDEDPDDEDTPDLEFYLPKIHVLDAEEAPAA